MKAHLALSTRIGVAILVSLTLLTAAVTVFIVSNPSQLPASTSAMSNLDAPTAAGGTAVDYVTDFLANPSDAAENLLPEARFGDLLPNRLFSVAGGEPEPLAAGIVVGTVTGATGAVSYDNLAGATAPFDADTAATRVIVIDIAVEYGTGAASGLDSISVGLRVPGTIDGETAVEGLGDWGRVIVAFDAPGTFEFDTELAPVRGGYRLLGSVAADGTISFPAFGTGEASFLDGIDTIDRLKEEAAGETIFGTIDNGQVVVK